MKHAPRIQRRTGVSMTVALVGFLMACVVVLLLSTASTAERDTPAQDALESTAQSLKKAIDELRKADRALTEQNYGDVRSGIRRAEQILVKREAALSKAAR